MQGDASATLASLERALTLSKPEGYVRVFIDEGRPMARLLLEASAQGIEPDYVNTLLPAFNPEAQTQENEMSRSSALPPETQPLIEPLTPREQEVLQHMAAGHSNPEIATQLVISVTTVKTHVKNLYGKLQVRNRIQAIARAKALDLL